ncbi:hypothetical protein ACSSS7_007989 [Eimeria intestinalis]
MDSATPPKRVPFQGPCYLKVLVNNLVAGAIIGKSGAVIAQIEQQTGCALKLSPANMYYPGTEERILIMSGEQEALNNAILVVLDKIHEMQCQYTPDGSRRESYDDSTSPSQPPSSVKVTLRIVVPKAAVAAIIGKGGQQIKELQSSTHARVQVSNREEALVERLVTITGSLEEARAAAVAISSCLQSEPSLKSHMYVVYKPGGLLGGPLGYAQQQPLGYGGPLPYGGYPAPFPQELLTQQCEIYIQVPEAVVGAVIGKSGRCVSEVMKQSGARVQVSQKGDFVPGTTDRKVTVSGSVAAVHNAHILLLQRVNAAHEAAVPPPSNGIGADLHAATQPHPMLPASVQYVHPTGFGY